MDKKKFNILFKHFANPIFDLRMTYKDSYLTHENHLVDSKVSKAFDDLYKALEEQLNRYRK